MSRAHDIAPPHRPANPAGRRSLAFRLAGQPGFARFMLDLLRQPTLTRPDGEVAPNALQPLNPDDAHGFVPGLLSAWAAVGDVLTFYQERIANEGYLATAVESFSLRELAASIGYSPRPALSANTHLAFMLLDARGAARRVTVPKGTAIQSVPAAGQSPALFETDADIEARREWNAIAPLLTPPKKNTQIVPRAERLRVAGNLVGLLPSMPIVLHDLDRPNGEGAVLVRQVTTVEPDVADKTTSLGWQKPLEVPPGASAQQPLFTAPEVLMFRKAARLFGATAPDWARQPLAVQAKVGHRIGEVAIAASPSSPLSLETHNDGLPPTDVSALAIDDAGTVFAAAGDAVLAYSPEQKKWTQAGTLPRGSLASVLIAPGTGVLYAGTQLGLVLCSSDGGRNWFSLIGHGAVPKGNLAALPSAPLRALATMPGPHGVGSVVAGTGFGIWVTSAHGGNWRPWNDGLPDYKSDQGTAGVTVNALVRDPVTEWWVAATDQGLFFAHGFEAAWHASHALEPPPPPPPPPPLALPAPPALLALPAPSVSTPARPWWRFWRRAPAASAPEAAAPTPPVVEPEPPPPVVEAQPPPPPAPAAPRPPPGAAVHALAILPGRDGAIFFAGTEQGVQRSTDARHWHPTNRLPGDAGDLPIAQLAANETGLFAGTSKGLFHSTDGMTWNPVAGALAAQSVAALASAAGHVAAAAPFGGYRDEEWPDFLGSGVQVDLDQACPALVPGSWVVLVQDAADGNGEPTLRARRVVSSALVRRQAFQLSGQASRVTLAPPLDATFNPRTTTVYLYSRALDLVDPPEPPPTFIGAEPASIEAKPGPIVLAGPVDDLAGRLISISGRRAGARLIGRAGGVRCWDGKQWTSVGTANYDGQALLFSRDGSCLLGTKTGVYRLGANNWEQFGTLKENILALAESADGAIIAGGNEGVWAWGGTQWSAKGLHGVSALLAHDGQLLAGTKTGIFISRDNGTAWAPADGDIKNVNALATDGNGTFVAGTDDGLFVAGAKGWGAAVSALNCECVNALTADARGYFHAGTWSGVFTSIDGGNSWQAEEAKELHGDIRALAVHPRTGLHAGRRGVGLVTPAGSFPAGIANDIRSLAFSPDGALYAGSFSSSVLLSADGRISVMEPKFIDDVTVPDGRADVSSWLPSGPIGQDVRHALAVKKIMLPEKAQVKVEQEGAVWCVSGSSGTNYLLHAVGQRTVRVFLQTDLAVLGPPKPYGAPPVPGTGPALQSWRLRTEDGIDATLIAGGKGEIELAPASSDETVADVRRIEEAAIVPDRSRTEAGIDAPLSNVYDAATVTINANVAPASHGETPALYEVIGSGDNSQPNQSFVLKRSPVTAHATTTAAGFQFDIAISVRPALPGEPLALSAQLRPRDVDDQAVAWQQVETLTSSGPNDQHYEVRERDDATVVVTFGDGTHGMRLPTGEENVIALYRTGSGPDGNVDANTLILPRKRPAGIRQVTNPAGATGGTLREENVAVRQTAPTIVRNLGRIVSLSDYEAFVRARPGIAKARSALLTARGRRALLHITVAGADGASPSGNVDHDELLAAVRSNRAVETPVRIEQFVPRWFALAADLTIAPGRQWDHVRDAVCAALLAHYGFAARGLAEPVHAADVMARIQEVRGVRAVHLTALHLSEANAELQTTLTASAARWIDGGELTAPAQLLMLADAASITLNEPS